MKRQIYIDNKHEYDFEQVNNTFNLYFSVGAQWNQNTKGKLALSIIDDGNGFKISNETPQKKKNNLDYSYALYLTILLKIIYKEYKFEISNKITF